MEKGKAKTMSEFGEEFKDSPFSKETLVKLFGDKETYQNKVGSIEPPIPPILQFRVAAMAFRWTLGLIDEGESARIVVFKRKILNLETKDVKEKALVIDPKNEGEVLWLRNVYEILAKMSVDEKSIPDIPKALDWFTLAT